MSTYEDIGYTKSDKDRNREINAIIGRQTITSILDGLKATSETAKEEKPAEAIPGRFKAYKDLYGVDH
jgi:hypothetical protein